MKPWLIVIGIDKFYLTDKEKDYYLSAIKAEVKFVELEDKVLGANFQYIAKDTAIEETKMLDEGKWLCPKGKWHGAGWECTCDVKEKLLE